MSSTSWVIWAVEDAPEAAENLAPVVRKKFSLLDDDVLLASGGIVAALIIGAIVIAVLQRWKRRQLADEATDLNNVTSYRTMLATGELSRDEYDRILKRVGQRTLGKIAPVSAAPPQAPPKESEPPQSNQ